MTRRRRDPVAQHSFLRHADPRTKLVLSLAASLAVMLSPPRLAVFLACYVVLVGAAGLLRQVSGHVWRLRLLLLVLFALDYLFIGLGFAIMITLRLVLLATAFTLLFATTTPEEVRVALERAGVPQRLAFTFAMAYRSLELVQTEWLGIIEAQRARGIAVEASGRGGWAGWCEPLKGAVSLIVPAVVLMTQRAWSITEAAAVRGFESPRRRPCRNLRLARLDQLLLAGTTGLFLGLYTLQ